MNIHNYAHKSGPEILITENIGSSVERFRRHKSKYAPYFSISNEKNKKIISTVKKKEALAKKASKNQAK